jgi:hypothetical protein
MGAVITYIRSIHPMIDPDFFDIPEEKLSHAGNLLKADAAEVTYQDMLFLQTLVDAAGEYGGRSDNTYPAPDARRLDRLSAWLAQNEDALFRARNTRGA